MLVQALDYLVAEVFPHFEQTSYTELARKQNLQVCNSISAGLGALYSCLWMCPIDAILHFVCAQCCSVLADASEL